MTGRQLSFFSAAARAAQPNDVEGLLCGPGQIVRRGGLARVSVVVDAERAEPLSSALREAGLSIEIVAAPGGQTSVRTSFDPALAALADAWSGAAGKRAPTAVALDGARLRLWAIASGGAHPGGYRLGLGAHDDSVWPTVGAALAAAGLAAVFVGPRADGPAYRIAGLRRLDRLRELVGDPPDGVPAADWP